MGAVATSAPDATRWGAIAAIVAAGIVAAMQIGKVAIATPMLQADLGLGLAALGWVTGIFAVLGLFGGIPVGVMVARTGGRRMLGLGLLIAAAGGAMGALCANVGLLLVSRGLEGAGFLLITVAGPSLLERLSTPMRRNLTFAFWSCFMPAGMAIAMLAGPFFLGWREFWWANVALILVIAAAVPLLIPADRSEETIATDLGAGIATTLRSRAPLALAAGLALYSLMFFALFSFLPMLLMQRMGLSHHAAGSLSALASAVNITGNLAAGLLLSRGVGRVTLLVVGNLIMGLTGLLIFLPILPDSAVLLMCLLFSAVGGLVPATILSSAPIAARAAPLIPIVLGLIIQGNNLGQIIGPVVVGGAIQSHGWPAAAAIVGAAALLAAIVALKLARDPTLA